MCPYRVAEKEGRGDTREKADISTEKSKEKS